MQRTALILALAAFAGCMFPGIHAQLGLDISVSNNLDPVDKSFLGLSMEPLRLATNFTRQPEFVKLIKHLASFDTGPFNIRWGGNSEDTLNHVLSDDYWYDLWFLHNETGCVYTIGLNLLSQDVELAVTQLTNALNILPPESIYSIEIGNEPDRFENLHPDEYPEGYMLLREGGWYEDQKKYIDALSPIVEEKLGSKKWFSGPALSDISNWRTEYINRWFRDFADYAKEVSCHWYATKSTYSRATFDTLMSNTMTTVTQTNGGRWAKLADAYGASFRFSETNTFSLGGKAGVSDTLGAAVFIVDYAMSNIAGGIHGMNLHMGACSPYSAIMLPIRCDNAGCVQYCEPLEYATARAPYYGMWLIQDALSGGVERLTWGANARGGKIKSYTFVHRASNELRIVLVQKNYGVESVDLMVRQYVRNAQVYLLTGPSMDAQVPEVTYAGRRIDDDGDIVGDLDPIKLNVKNSGVATMSFAMPGYSAALVVLKL